jgi:hypothetical protein
MMIHNVVPIRRLADSSAIAARLTDAVYPVVLRLGISGSWLDLEIAFWTAFAEFVETMQPTTSKPDSRIETVRRQTKLSRLAEVAYRTSVQYGLRESFHEVEPSLRRALCLAVEVFEPDIWFECTTSR